MTITFVDYQTRDTDTVLHFIIADPGAGKDSDATVTITDAERNAATTAALFQTLCLTKLRRKYRDVGLTNLDPFVGGSLVL